MVHVLKLKLKLSDSDYRKWQSGTSIIDAVASGLQDSGFKIGNQNVGNPEETEEEFD
jgi:ABC-type taurine transport system substrate-binding protein